MNATAEAQRPQEALQKRSPSEFSDLKQAKMLRQLSEDGPSKVNLFKRVYSGQASPRQAIKAKCLECAWLAEVVIRECTATSCPLYRFRPFQRKAEVDE